MIQKRLSSLQNQIYFDRAKTPYQNALKNSGYNTKLEFKKQCNIELKKRRKRKKKIFYFNPPFFTSVTTNVGREFLNLAFSVKF